MRTIRTGSLALILGAAGCQPAEPDTYAVYSPAPATGGAFFEITLHNFDPALYQIRVEWITAAGRLESVLVDVIDAFMSDTLYHDAFLGAPYWLVLADFQGSVLDSVSIGSIGSASEGPVVVTYLVVGGRFVP